MSDLRDYLAHVRLIKASGLATDERSYYPALDALFNAAGRELTPRVVAIHDIADRGAAGAGSGAGCELRGGEDRDAGAGDGGIARGAGIYLCSSSTPPGGGVHGLREFLLHWFGQFHRQGRRKQG